MLISEMNWMQVEEFLESDDRCILPTGSTEQHAYLSLDRRRHPFGAARARSWRSWRRARLSRRFPMAWRSNGPPIPGTVTLRVETYLALIRDVLDSIRRAGFRRILLINGHGGNAPAQGMLREWMMDNPDSNRQMAQLVQRAP